MKINKLLIFSIFIISLFVSCNRNEIYFNYQSLPAKGWNKDSVIKFEYYVQDTVSTYNLYIHVRHRGNYPYQNMWLFLETENPKKVIIKDTIEFYLADQYGKWLGNGAGALKEMPVFYKQNILLPDTGKYTVQIRQGMRDSILVGINDIGLRVEKVNTGNHGAEN